MNRRFFHIVAPLLLALTVATIAPCARAADSLDPAKVTAAIDGGVRFLERLQKPRDGMWPETIRRAEEGSATALCTLALLNCGAKPTDGPVQRALESLRSIKGETTYFISLQTMVLSAATPKRDLQKIQTNVRLLESMQIADGPNEGCWTYTKRQGQFRGDNSNAQFAVLALHEAERAGAKVNAKTWKRALAYWLKAQHNDGGWGYVNPLGNVRADATGSMTCAGIASVIICADRTGDGDARIDGDKISCCNTPQKDEATEAIENGMRWLGVNFSVTGNPNSHQGKVWYYYYLYALERVGRMSSRRWIVHPSGKAHDWFRRGTDQLLASQDPISRFWKGDRDEEHPLVATSLALLFLSKGRRPVLISRVRHGDGTDWDRHRSALGRLTRYVETKWELELTHQVMELNKATLDDLMQSPVLFLSGRAPVTIGTAGRRVLREYLDQGGFLLVESCCGDEAFEDSVRSMLASNEMFPAAELAPLAPDHPIFGAEEKLDPSYVGKIFGIQAGCRTSVVFVKDQLSCHWELDRAERGAPHPRNIEHEIAMRKAVGINIVAYATGRKLKYKYEIPERTEAIEQRNQPRGTIVVAKLQHSGGCDEAPLALPNLLEEASRRLDMKIEPAGQLIPIADGAIFDYHLVFMHGRSDFTLTAAQRKTLRTYVQRGGTVVADSIGSNRAFAEAFRREINATFAGIASLAPIKPDRLPIRLRIQDVGFDIREVSLRQPVAAAKGEPRRVRTTKITPDLQAIELDDRYGVIFSPYDLSCALEKHESLEFEGYTRDDAFKIALNIVLYSLQR